MTNKKKYVAPHTELRTVELESGFMVASNIDTKIEQKDVEINVEGYEPTIENDVTFN